MRISKPLIIPILFLFFCLIFTGCSGSPAEEANIEHLEKYVEEEAGIGADYTYLKPVELHKEEMEIAVYAFDGADGNETVTSEKDGITITHTLRKGDISNLLDEQTGKIKEEKGAEDGYSDHYEIEDDGAQYAVMTYNIIKDQIVYPCIEIARVESLGDGYCLVSHVKIDNTMTNDKTQEVLREVIAYMDIQLS